MQKRNYKSTDDKCESMNPALAGTRGVGDGTTGGADGPRLDASYVSHAAVRVAGITTVDAHGGFGELDQSLRQVSGGELKSGELQKPTSTTKEVPVYRPMPKWCWKVTEPTYGGFIMEQRMGRRHHLAGAAEHNAEEFQRLTSAEGWTSLEFPYYKRVGNGGPDERHSQDIAAELNARGLNSQTSGAAEYLSSREQGLRDEADALQRQLEELRNVVRAFSDREREEQFLREAMQPVNGHSSDNLPDAPANMPSVNVEGQEGTHSLSSERQFSGDPAVGRGFMSPSPTVPMQDHSGQTAGESSPVNCTFRPLAYGWGASTPTYGRGGDGEIEGPPLQLQDAAGANSTCMSTVGDAKNESSSGTGLRDEVYVLRRQVEKLQRVVESACLNQHRPMRVDGAGTHGVGAGLFETVGAEDGSTQRERDQGNKSNSAGGF